MRTDVKIGAAVGLAVVALLVLYIVIFSTPKTDSTQTAAQDQRATEIADVIQPGLGQGETIAPSFGSAGRPNVFQVPSGIGEDESVSVDVPLTPTTIAPTPAPAVAVDAPSGTPPAGRPVIGPVATTPPVPPTPAVPPVPAAPAAPKTPDYYVVKQGDNGFWPIAAKVYGNGKYMNLIAGANKGVSSTSLKVGQKLIIPPLPPGTLAPAATVGVVAGGPRPVASGKGSYTVKKGQGYWSIAQEVYGNGKYWTAIQAANPDKKSLQPGMVLVVPDIPGVSRVGGPATPARAPAAPSPAEVSPTTAPAQPVATTSSEPARPRFR